MLRSILPILRGMGVMLIDAANWGMHPASPYRSIIRRNQWARGKW